MLALTVGSIPAKTAGQDASTDPARFADGELEFETRAVGGRFAGNLGATGAPAEYSTIEETMNPAALDLIGDWNRGASLRRALAARERQLGGLNCLPASTRTRMPFMIRS